MTASVIDHEALGLSRIATQYQNAARFRAFLSALLAQANELEQVYQSLALITDIDQAEGVNLDVIGDIVGVPRIITEAIIKEFFGFSGALLAQNFGEEGNPAIGGRFRDEVEGITGSTVLADPEYRLLIRAKIVRNHARGTNDDVLNGLSYLFGGVPCQVEDLGGMAIGIAIGRPITNIELAILTTIDILPRPAGVRISWRGYYNSEAGYLGFDGQPGAVPFVEDGDAGPEGFLMEEF